MNYQTSWGNISKNINQRFDKWYKILNSANYFSSGIFQNYLVFIPAKKYIKYFSGTTQIYSCKSNEMPEESIENVIKSDNLLHQLLLIFIYYQMQILIYTV